MFVIHCADQPSVYLWVLTSQLSNDALDFSCPLLPLLSAKHSFGGQKVIGIGFDNNS